MNDDSAHVFEKDHTHDHNVRECHEESSSARRRFLLAAGAGLGLSQLRAGTAHAASSDETFEIYDEDTHIELEEDGAALIQKAYDLGYKYHREHGGCCRCTVAALQDALDMVPKHPGMFRAATCLDAGAAPGRILSCGCFTGAGIAIGYICGGENFACRDLAHSLIQKIARKYQEEFGSVLCDDAIKMGNCSKLTGLTAQWTAEVLLEQFTEYTPEAQ